jgi:hypothetical protein
MMNKIVDIRRWVGEKGADRPGSPHAQDLHAALYLSWRGVDYVEL